MDPDQRAIHVYDLELLGYTVDGDKHLSPSDKSKAFHGEGNYIIFVITSEEAQFFVRSYLGGIHFNRPGFLSKFPLIANPLYFFVLFCTYSNLVFLES